MKPSKNKVHVPFYNDGICEVFKIVESDDVVTRIELEPTNRKITFKEIGVTDKLRSTLNSENVDVQMKIRMPYVRKLIDTQCVLKIEDTFFKVYNVYHFENSDGFKESDLTLINWSDDFYE